MLVKPEKLVPIKGLKGESMEQVLKETKVVKEVKVVTPEAKPFVKLSDLSKENITQPEFMVIDAKMIKQITKTGFRTRIQLAVDPQFLTFDLQPGGTFVTLDRFNLILLKLSLSTVDKKNRPVTAWNLRVPVRFVKGKYSDGNEYYSLEVVFKQYLYDTHFFSSDQVRILQELEAHGIFKPYWVERPDAIEKITDFTEAQF